MSSPILLRIEHKLDLLIQAMQAQGMMLPSPLPSLQDKSQDTCPVCGQLQRFSIDTASESVDLTCGCKPPIRAIPGISLVGLPPVTQKKESPNDDDDSSEAGGEDPGPVGPAPAQRA